MEDHLSDNDYQLFRDVQKPTEIHLVPGMFAVFFPKELHRPGCCVETCARIKKIVGIVNSLKTKLQHGEFEDFSNEVNAQKGKKLSDEAANILVKLVKELKSLD